PPQRAPLLERPRRILLAVAMLLLPAAEIAVRERGVGLGQEALEPRQEDLAVAVAQVAEHLEGAPARRARPAAPGLERVALHALGRERHALGGRAQQLSPLEEGER